MTPEKQLLKIADLSARTGVPKDSIRYYVKEGLLPPPRKTSRNMAYYEAATYVPRIRLIKELQESRFLPLRVIREILSAEGGPTTVEELDTLSALDGKMFRNGVPGAPPKPMLRKDVAARVDVPEDELRALEAVGLLTPEEQDGAIYYSPVDIQLAEAIGQMRGYGYRPDAGFPPETYRVYIEAIESLARRELGTFAQGVTGRKSPSEMVAMAEAGVMVVNKLLGILREKILLSLLHEYRVEMESGQRPARERGD